MRAEISSDGRWLCVRITGGPFSRLASAAHRLAAVLWDDDFLASLATSGGKIRVDLESVLKPGTEVEVQFLLQSERTAKQELEVVAAVEKALSTMIPPQAIRKES